MVENIKSNFFVRYLFTLIEDIKQLQLAKYNKSLQKILNINIMNFRVLSCKYTIYKYETNRNGKIYDAFENKLLFEGEFINGKRNGKGKKYNIYGNLIFEGEYLNGKRNGKGKEYNDKGEIIFEGEYLYNYRRKGKEYIKGKLEYEGEYLYKRKWQGKVYDENNKIIYEIIMEMGNVENI